MADRTVLVKRLTTKVADKVVDVELSYNDGSMRRAHRGYWLSARVWTEENGMRSTDLFGGGATKMVEATDRFNAKRLTTLADELTQRRIEVDNLVDGVREKAGV